MKHTHLLLRKALPAALSVLVLAAGCTAKKDGENAATTDTLATDTAMMAAEETAPANKTEEFLQSLPSPIHLARMFNRSGLKYVGTLPADPSGAVTYQSATARALNLGIYTTDLGYATFNNQNQKSVDYFKAVKTLGDGLNMTSMFDQTNLVPRFEKNLGNKDSLVYLLSQLSLESDMLLRQADRLDVIYLSFAGAFVESMHLATSLVGQNTNGEVMNRILDQQNSLSKLIQILEEAEGDGMKDAIDGLKDMQEKLAKLAQTKGTAESPEFKELQISAKNLRDKITQSV